ncbi:glycosyltransferase [Sulfurimonas sp.]|uniref:glycosyltransferase n=1 Tax=Sulfurimonas sp. TaxID=2022749 RepID=UPI00262D7961|nr:glycosyltransferase [Sulfurimonas sp.]
MKKNILIISIYYPPIQSIASNRIYSFAKYLDKDKYNVYVHTLESENSVSDDKDIVVRRSKNNIFFKPLLFAKRTNKFIHYSKVIYNKFVRYFFEDEYRGWIAESLQDLPTFIKKNDIDIVISTYAPAAPHIVALELKKKFPNLKWIADMRDEMSQGLGLNFKLKEKYVKLENEIFTYANAVTSVSKPLVNEFQSLSNNKGIIFREIRNGYDFALEEIKNDNAAFTITYMGNFYGQRNPVNFLTALHNLLQKDSAKKVFVQLVGVKTHFEIPELLQERVSVIAYVKHSEAIGIMKKSDALLLIHPANGRKGVFTGKLFEYLAALKPIIALVDEEDVAAKLIRDANAGYISDNANIEKIEMILEEAYLEWKAKRKREFNIDIIKKHHRRAQAKRLEYLIDEICDER